MSAEVAEWATEAHAYELLGKIGQGAFATVWRARTRASNEDCAVKVLNLDHVDTNLAEIRLEVQAMRLSSHPNVLRCHTAFVQDIHLWLVTPLMRKGSSLHCIEQARRVAENLQTEPHILYILRETLLGLQYIHENGQIHRDIKAGNILLDDSGDVRIADFGVSGWLVQAGSQQEKAKTFVGTPCWMAPEVMEQVHGYSYTADVWSLGITALELAKGYAPYAKYPPMKVLILTIQEDPPTLDTYDEYDDDDQRFSEVFSKTFRGLVDLCLQKDPSKRPTCQELLQNKILSPMNDPAQREFRKEALRVEICGLVKDVGTGLGEQAEKSFPGNKPVSFVLSEGKDRPAGTTWIFADGSQILSSTATRASTVDDILEELDAFGQETGGEHYERDRRPSLQEEDELEKFMDEFELNTAGEDFRRKP